MTSTHSQAFPQTITHDVGDVVITFKPLVVKNLGKFAAAIKPIMSDERIDTLFAYAAQGDGQEAQAAAMIQDMAGEYSEQIIVALMAVSDVDVQWLESQDIDVLITLAQKAIEVNRDYFLPRITPRLVKAMMAQSKTGEVSVGDLSPVGTDTATSSTTP